MKKGEIMKLNKMIEAAKAARAIRKEREVLGVNPAMLMENPMAAMGKMAEIGQAVELSTKLEDQLLVVAADHERLIASVKSFVDGAKGECEAFGWLTEGA